MSVAEGSHIAGQTQAVHKLTRERFSSAGAVVPLQRRVKGCRQHQRHHCTKAGGSEGH